MPKIPKASYKNSIYSGIILGALGALCNFAEIDNETGPGPFGITIGLVTTIFFIISCIFFVGGFENFWEIDPRKASYWRAHFPRLKRGLVYLVSAIITGGLIVSLKT